ncbi:hypothetical protein FHS21_002117 [Phyllobacterium trifolii]|jgi:uncharacterized DUF497 family protein|uniref:BrnT family toxin n=1 Tax=Phyllobacterium trifolii TaxID=300193 RepID=A0A839U6V5_9HYPH|nr:BrnT family toxin [Phyllobacterium trifolii]MBB3145705.1 hypothetical protein [Phyllobacterium trifolii]
MSRFEWDLESAKANLRKHGVDFGAAEKFEFNTALEQLDDRHNYEEERIVAIGFIGPSLFTLVYTERRDKIRVISLRKSKTIEIRKYAKYYE